jgi:hypothetical protein
MSSTPRNEQGFVMDDQIAARPGLDEAGLIQATWRCFLRALASEIDAQGGAAARDELLRGIGRRMARLMPLPEVASMEALEMEMNDALKAIGWGAMRLALREGERSLIISHVGLPRIGAAGDPPGLWLSAVLEGLYETWLGQQPDSDNSLIAQRIAVPAPDTLTLRYGKA